MRREVHAVRQLDSMPTDLTAELLVRRLQPDDADQMAVLRIEALTSAPLAFGSSPQDDRFASTSAVRDALMPADDHVVFGLFHGQRLQGMAGAYHSRNDKERHKAYIWGMYVRREARRRGGATRLLGALVDWARGIPDVLQVLLSVTDAAPDARRLYQKAGFTEWGVEPRALHWQGEFTAERHLVLPLDLPSER